MVLAIFIWAIFLAFSVGFATMSLVAARGLRFQSEDAEAIRNNLACAYSPIRTFSPSLGARLQASRFLLTPRP